MKILLATGFFLPNIGGLETHVKELALRFHALGHDVEIVADRAPLHTLGFEKFQGIPIFRTPQYPLRALKIPLYIRTAQKRIKKFYPDIIHCHMCLPASFSMQVLKKFSLFEIPLVTTIHGDDILTIPSLSWGHRLRPLTRLMTDWSLLNADRVICVSKHIRGECLKIGVPEAKTEVIYNGVERASARRPRSETPSKHRKTVLFVGRLVEEKGIQFLVEAMSHVLQKYNCILQIVGDGPYRSRLETLAERLGVRKNMGFEGFVKDHILLRKYYKASDIFVLPSLVEGSTISLLEAMSSGLPVVCSEVGGLPEIVEEGRTGFLVPPQNPKALADRIITLLKNSSLRLEMGGRGVERAGEYTWDRMVNEVVKVYRSLID